MTTNIDLVDEYFFGDDISEEALELVNDYAAQAFRDSEHIKDFVEDGEELPSLALIHFKGMHTDFLIQCSNEQKKALYNATATLMEKDGKL